MAEATRPQVGPSLPLAAAIAYTASVGLAEEDAFITVDIEGEHATLPDSDSDDTPKDERDLGEVPHAPPERAAAQKARDEPERAATKKAERQNAVQPAS